MPESGKERRILHKIKQVEWTFTNVAEIEKADFSGFRKMDELFADSSMIPKTKGVYFVLYTANSHPHS